MNERKYYRIRLGSGNSYAEECCKGSFIGADYDIDQDLTNYLPPQYEKFNAQFIPIWLERNPQGLERSPRKAKIAAGLACGSLHTISKGIKIGSIVLCPDGKDSYLVGEVTGDYYYCPDQNLPHRRKVRWLPDNIDQEDMSLSLQKTVRARNVTINVDHHTEEIESLLQNQIPKTIFSSDDTIEDPTVFALEKHLEEFLVEKLGEHCYR
jgi:restriction system protein